MEKRLCTKNLGFKISNFNHDAFTYEQIDVNPALIDLKQRLNGLVIDKWHATSGVLYNTGELYLIRNNGRFDLKTPALDLAGVLKVSEVSRIHLGKVPVITYIRKNIVLSESDARKIIWEHGDSLSYQMQVALVTSGSESCRNSRVYQMMKTMDIEAVLEAGMVPITQTSQLLSARQYMHQVETDRIFNSRPDAEGPVPLKFQKFIRNQNNDGCEPDPDVAPFVVNFIARPGDETTKKKHLYVYSYKPGYGKTTVANKLVSDYKAIVVTDVNNWMDMPTGAQFCIFDEMEQQKSLPWCLLKKLTSGSCTGFSGNRKNHGASFRFDRKDVQTIIFSNKSPYEVFADSPCAASKSNDYISRVMSIERADQFHDRFQVVRLDGDYTSDYNKFVKQKERTVETCWNNMCEQLQTLRSRLAESLDAPEALDMFDCVISEFVHDLVADLKTVKGTRVFSCMIKQELRKLLKPEAISADSHLYRAIEACLDRDYTRMLVAINYIPKMLRHKYDEALAHRMQEYHRMGIDTAVDIDVLNETAFAWPESLAAVSMHASRHHGAATKGNRKRQLAILGKHATAEGCPLVKQSRP